MMVKSVIEGTAEMKDLILNELDLIFECRSCKNLFRSLINFVDHKRNYRKTHACESMVLFDPIAISYRDQRKKKAEQTVVVQPEAVQDENGTQAKEGTKVQPRRNSTQSRSSATIPESSKGKIPVVREEASATVVAPVNPTASTSQVVTEAGSGESMQPNDKSNDTNPGAKNLPLNCNKPKPSRSFDMCLEKLIKDKTSSAPSTSSTTT